MGWAPSKADENCRALSLPSEGAVRTPPSATQAESSLDADPTGALISDLQTPGWRNKCRLFKHRMYGISVVA